MVTSNVLGISNNEKKVILSDHVFRSSFVASPRVVVELLKWYNFRPYVQPKHLLWSLLFLKKYDTNSNLSAQIGADEKTFWKYIWKEILPEIGRHLPTLVTIKLFFCKYGLTFT